MTEGREKPRVIHAALAFIDAPSSSLILDLEVGCHKVGMVQTTDDPMQMAD